MQQEELMDHALVRFRKAAARENRDRLRPRYSVALQRDAVDYWRARQREGDGLRDMAAALGVAPWSCIAGPVRVTTTSGFTRSKS